MGGILGRTGHGRQCLRDWLEYLPVVCLAQSNFYNRIELRGGDRDEDDLKLTSIPTLWAKCDFASLNHTR